MRGRRRARRAPVDRRIADHQRRGGARDRGAAEDAAAPPDPACGQTGRRRRARRPAEKTRQVEAVENAPRRGDRFVRQNRERARRRGSASSTRGDAVVRARVIQQPLVVEREIPFERVGRTLDAARLERARDERRRRLSPTIAPIRSSGIGAAPHDSSSALAASAMIAPRIDQRPVEIEDERVEKTS